MADLNHQTVDTGDTILILINSQNILGKAQTLEVTRDFGTIPVYEMGTAMAVEHIPAKYSGGLTMERMRMRKKSLAHAGLVGLGEDILGLPVFKITTIDRYTKEVGIIYQGLTPRTYDEGYHANQIVTERASFYFLDSIGVGDYAPAYQAPAKPQFAPI